MSRSRHMKRHHAAGGKVAAYAGGDSNVMKEAQERKRGGRVHHLEGEGEKGKHRADKRARGGKVVTHHHHHAAGGHVEHHHYKRGGGVHDGHPDHHADGGVAHHKAMHAKTPGRKRGGGIGANLKPLSTAANIKEVTKGEQREDEPKDGKGGSPIA